MVRRYRWITLSAAFAALLAVGVCVYAQGPGPGGPGGRGGRGGPALGLAMRDLNLSDTQQQQVRDIMQRHRDENRQAADRLRAAMDAQRKAVETVPVNEGLIRSTTQELAQAQTDVAIQRARVQSEIFTILTPEQQEKAKQLQAQRDSRIQQQQQRFQDRLQRRQQKP